MENDESVGYLDNMSKQGSYNRRDLEGPGLKILLTVDMIPPESYSQGSSYYREIKTPAMKELQSSGVNFTNATSVSPLCGPSRASLFTGRYPYLLVNKGRAHAGIQSELRLDDPIFQEYLQNEGHIIRHVGKCHVGAEKFIKVFGENDTPWDQWAPPIQEDDEYRDYLADFGIQGLRFGKIINGLQQDRQTEGNFYGGWITDKDGGEFPIEATYPFFLVKKAVKKLDIMLNQRSSEEKLFLQLDFFSPHQPFFVPEQYARKRLDDLKDSVELPQTYLDLKKDEFQRPGFEPLVYHQYRKNWGLYDKKTARDYIVTNLLQIEVMDRAINHFLEALKTRDLYQDCMIAFAGDHGEMNVERGLIDKGTYGHPKVSNVPLVMKLPENKYAGKNIQELVSLMDIAPTFLDIEGIDPSAFFDGKSLLDCINNREKIHGEGIVFETFWHVTPNPAVALKVELGDGRHYMYTFNLASEYDELYLLEDQNYTNLLKKGSHEEEAREMRKKLKAKLQTDKRWGCFRDSFRLAYPEVWGFKNRDFQKFDSE